MKMIIPLEQNGDFIMCCDPSLDLNPLIPKKRCTNKSMLKYGKMCP